MELSQHPFFSTDKRKDIQVQAANLVMDAERAIAKANPPRQGERTDKNNFGISNPEVEPVPETTIRDLKKLLFQTTTFQKQNSR